MRYQTELMRAILTNKKSKEIIDYVSQIYGDSYVALWLYQAIGTVLGEVCDIAEKLRSETNVTNADLLLDYWESHYGILKDNSLSKEQRRNRIIVKAQSRGPCNPVKLASAVSAAIGNIPVVITENTGKNAFLVNVQGYVESIEPIVAVLERMKPAHLIYELRISSRIVTENEIKIAVAMTRTERYKVEVSQ